jgi:hypothetical protein
MRLWYMYRNTINGMVSMMLSHFRINHWAALNFLSKFVTTLLFVKNSKVTANIRNMLDMRPSAERYVMDPSSLGSEIGRRIKYCTGNHLVCLLRI